MDYLVAVELLEGQDDAGTDELGLLFGEYLAAGDVQTEVAPGEEVHD